MSTKQKFKARSQFLVKSEDGTNARLMSYLCSQHPIKECFKPGFFNSVASNLLPGDQVRCIQITRKQKPEDEVVSASWTGIVIKVCKKKGGQEEVVFVPVDGQGLQEYKEPEEELVEEEEYNGPEYIQGDGQVERNQRSGTYTVKMKGEEVCTVDTKEEAASIARGDVPIPDIRYII